MTIILLVLLSTIFVIMMGVAGVKLLEAAKGVQRSNEAYNYLLVMEELGQSVARARSLGRDVDCRTPYVAGPTGCPGGTVRRTVNTGAINTTICPGVAGPNRNHYTLCVPDRNSNGAVDVSEFCTQIDGFNYCLSGGTFAQNLERLDITASETTDHGRPGPYVELGGAATEQTNGGVLLPRNNRELWSPNAAWAANNEIFTTNCQGYTAGNNSRYWLGCHYCADPRLECWALRMCPKSTAANPTCTAAERVTQRVVIYFENNRR